MCYNEVKSVAHWLCLSIARKVLISPVSGCAEGSPCFAVPGEVPVVAGRRGVSLLGVANGTLGNADNSFCAAAGER